MSHHPRYRARSQDAQPPDRANVLLLRISSLEAAVLELLGRVERLEDLREWHIPEEPSRLRMRLVK